MKWLPVENDAILSCTFTCLASFFSQSSSYTPYGDFRLRDDTVKEVLKKSRPGLSKQFSKPKIWLISGSPLQNRNDFLRYGLPRVDPIGEKCRQNENNDGKKNSDCLLANEKWIKSRRYNRMAQGREYDQSNDRGIPLLTLVFPSHTFLFRVRSPQVFSTAFMPIVPCRFPLLNSQTTGEKTHQRSCSSVPKYAQKSFQCLGSQVRFDLLKLRILIS